jgi:hypothetical protein
MASFLKDLSILVFSSGGEIEKKAAEFKAQRERRAAAFAARVEREKTEPRTARGGIGAQLLDLAGELVEKLGLGTRAQTRELAERFGRRIAELFK